MQVRLNKIGTGLTFNFGSSKPCVLYIPFDANMTLWVLHQEKRQHRTSNVQHRTSKVVKLRFVFLKKATNVFSDVRPSFFFISIALVVAVNIPICTSGSIHHTALGSESLIKNKIERSDFLLRCWTFDVRCWMFISF